MASEKYHCKGCEQVLMLDFGEHTPWYTTDEEGEFHNKLRGLAQHDPDEPEWINGEPSQPGDETDLCGPITKMMESDHLTGHSKLFQEGYQLVQEGLDRLQSLDNDMEGREGDLIPCLHDRYPEMLSEVADAFVFFTVRNLISTRAWVDGNVDDDLFNKTKEGILTRLKGDSTPEGSAPDAVIDTLLSSLTMLADAAFGTGMYQKRVRGEAFDSDRGHEPDRRAVTWARSFLRNTVGMQEC